MGSGEAHATDFLDVTPFLKPRSVAVVGASDQPGNVGGAAVRFFLKFKSPCRVYPVNPNRATVAGLPCFANPASVPEPADLAILAVPAAAVLEAARACAAAGIKAGIVWAGGFQEGGPEGAALQERLVEFSRESGFAILGPNCLGVIDAHAPMTASFASMLLGFDRLLPGNVSMVSQSGGLATLTQALAQQSGCGFRYMISTGNESIATVSDFLRALVDDPKTKVIAVYLEGVRDGAKFRKALAAARAAGKPVIVLKAGETKAAAVAAGAHTGALVGEARVWEAVLRDGGALRAHSLEELLDMSMHLSGADLAKAPASRGVAIVTFGGGSGVVAADQCERAGLAVASFAASTRAELAGLVTPLASTRNPADLTPQTYLDPRWLSTFPAALDALAGDPAVGSLLFLMGPMSSGDAEMASTLIDFGTRCLKPVLIAWPLIPPGAAQRFREAGLHVFSESARAIRVLAGVWERTSTRSTATPPPALAQIDWRAFVPNARAGLVVTEDRCHALLREAGLSVAPGRLAKSGPEAARMAAEIGFPVALKGISPKVTHRAKMGLLALRLGEETAVAAAFDNLADRARSEGIALDGVLVQGMVEAGVEILVSAFRDPDFGVFVSLGAGGGLAELLDDVTLAPAPLDEAGAAEALGRLRVAAKGGETRQGLARWVARFASLAAAAPWRRFVFEVNPVIWAGETATAVDGLLIIEEP